MYGICSDCYGIQQVRRDGFVRKHRDPKVLEKRDCKGSGKKPIKGAFSKSLVNEPTFKCEVCELHYVSKLRAEPAFDVCVDCGCYI